MNLENFTQAYKSIIAESKKNKEDKALEQELKKYLSTSEFKYFKNYIKNLGKQIGVLFQNPPDLESELGKVAAEMEDLVTRRDFKKTVLPLLDAIPEDGKITQEFKDALENHVEKFGTDRQVSTFLGPGTEFADARNYGWPYWYNSNNKTVRLGASKFTPK